MYRWREVDWVRIAVHGFFVVEGCLNAATQSRQLLTTAGELKQLRVDRPNPIAKRRADVKSNRTLAHMATIHHSLAIATPFTDYGHSFIAFKMAIAKSQVSMILTYVLF
jgi:hypothetical protein